MITGIVAQGIAGKRGVAPGNTFSFEDDILAWWDPAEGIDMAGGVVNSWVAKIGGNTLVRVGSDTPSLDVNGLNGLPVINCTTAGRMRSPLTIDGDSLTACFVFKHVSTGAHAQGRILSFADPDYYHEDQFYARHFTFIRDRNSANTVIYRDKIARGVLTSSYDTWSVMVIRWGPTLSQFRNGSLLSTNNFFGNFVIRHLGVFNEVGGDEHARGKMADIIVIPRGLSDSEVGEVSEFLMNKYAIS